MGKASNRTARIHAVRSAVNAACRYCGVEVIVAQIGLFARLQRQYGLPGLDQVLAVLAPQIGPEGYIQMCPGCHHIQPYVGTYSLH